MQKPYSHLDSAWPAPLGRRLGALIYDGFLVTALWLAVSVAHLAFFRVVMGVEAGNVGIRAVEVWSLRFLLVGAVTLFFVYSWTHGGMTLGMQAWRLRVQRQDGCPISGSQALIRCLVAWPSLLMLGLGYWWAGVDGERRSWPDMVSGTQTVVLPPRHQ